MTNQQYLHSATSLLSSRSIATARLDSLVLMEFVLGIDRAKILAEPQGVISLKHQKVLNSLLSKRSKHIPISYITQQTEFYGRMFYIDESVLEPRPESETMVDLLKSLFKHNPLLSSVVRERGYIAVGDVGAGCGAIGITAALECANVNLDLIDIDKAALKVARNNVVIHTIDCKVMLGDLLVDNETAYDILLCNLPYVPDDFKINTAASHEPKIAIFGGKDGLDIYRKLFKILRNRQHKPLFILTESLPPSHKSLQAIAKKSGYTLKESQDFIQLFKHSDS